MNDNHVLCSAGTSSEFYINEGIILLSYYQNNHGHIIGPLSP